MADTTDLLQQLGFSEYEARAYLALLQKNPLNGYELARDSGLPRANIYSVLEKLEKRAAVVRLDTPEGVRYAPTPPKDLIQGIQDHFQGSLEKARSSLGEVTQAVSYDAIWNIHGYQAVLERARALLSAARVSVLIAVERQEARELKDSLAQAAGRGVQVTTLCLEGCEHECGSCQGRIFRYRVAPLEGKRWLVIIADQHEMFAGQIEAGDQALAVITRQALLVNLAAGYIRRSTALAVLLNDLGERLDQQISEPTREALAALGDPALPGGWLAQMRAMLEDTIHSGREGGDLEP